MSVTSNVAWVSASKDTGKRAQDRQGEDVEKEAHNLDRRLKLKAGESICWIRLCPKSSSVSIQFPSKEPAATLVMWLPRSDLRANQRYSTCDVRWKLLLLQDPESGQMTKQALDAIDGVGAQLTDTKGGKGKHEDGRRSAREQSPAEQGINNPLKL